MKVGKHEHPEHIFNNVSLKHLLFTLQGDVYNLMKGVKTIKNNSKYVPFPSHVVIIHACIYLLAERTKIALKYTVFTKTQDVVYDIIPHKSFRSCTVKYSIIP